MDRIKVIGVFLVFLLAIFIFHGIYFAVFLYIKLIKWLVICSILTYVLYRFNKTNNK